MTEDQAVEAVCEQWIAVWPTTPSGSVPYAFEGEVTPSSDTFAVVVVRHTTSAQVTSGGAGVRRFQRAGNIMVQLFSPTGAGRRPISLLVASVRTVLEGVNIGPGEPLNTGAAATREVPTDGRWLQQTVVVPFKYYETR